MLEIIQINEDKLKGQLSELVRGTVEETLNKLLDEETDLMTGAKRYERSEERIAPYNHSKQMPMISVTMCRFCRFVFSSVNAAFVGSAGCFYTLGINQGVVDISPLLVAMRDVFTN